jgi:hypothetical protein
LLKEIVMSDSSFKPYSPEGMIPNSPIIALQPGEQIPTSDGSGEEHPEDCYWNGQKYMTGSEICIGATMHHCSQGSWWNTHKHC